MIEKIEKTDLVIDASTSNRNINVVINRLNELIDAHNKLEEEIREKLND